jgi:hypothetical protein
MFSLLFCSSAECSSPAATSPRRRRQRSGHRPGHHDQVRATHSERRRGQRPRHHGQVPATHKGRRRGQRPRHHDQVLVTNNCRGQPTAWPPRPSTCVAPQVSAWAPRLKSRAQCLCVESEFPPCVHRTRTRINTNPTGTEASAAGRSLRTCVARESKREES